MMPSDVLVLFLLATLLLFIAHVNRAARWALLFPSHYLTRRFDLLFGLSIGYAGNATFAWGLGEIFRIFYVSRRESISFPFVVATVVAERLSDLLVIAMITLVLTFYFHTDEVKILPFGVFMLIAAATIVINAILVRRSVRVRRFIWVVTSIFNNKIQIGIVEFFWSLSELVLGGILFRTNYLFATCIMWCFYIGSYYTFGFVVGESFAETYFALLRSTSHPLIGHIVETSSPFANEMLALYFILPIFVVIVHGLVNQWSLISRGLAKRLRYGSSIYMQSQLTTRTKFKQDNEYHYFLACLFSADDQVLSGFGLSAMEDGVIQRLFKGGSDAITALVEVDQSVLIRKFAVGSAAKKLKTQAEWIKSRRHDSLPIVELIGEKQGDSFYRYDMPFVIPANDFYDIIHTSQIDRSKSLLKSVFEEITAFHQRNYTGLAAIDTVTTYLTNKAVKNTVTILDFAKCLLDRPVYRINRKDYRLSDWNHFLDIQWLSSQIHDLKTSIIHGDLTIENIIVAPEREAGLYIIDPNPENIFETPLIDLAKLMQSLHLGYESLNRGRMCSISDEGISLTITRSRAYSDLQEYFEQLIIQQYGIATLKEVYFHELVNYLRLTPYKIRKSPSEGLTFFASTSILLDRYLALQS